MPVLNMSLDDLVASFQREMPQGAIWPRDPDATLTATIQALLPGLERLVVQDNNLLTDAFPATAVNLLPEWESALGLPDPVSGQATTIAARQAQVVARLVDTGGQNEAFFIATATTLGFTITITKYKPYTTDLTTDLPDWDGGAAFAWQVNVTGSRTQQAQAMEYLFRRNRPANTLLRFVYSS